METSNDDVLSFDIIKCLPEEICDNIFDYLKSRDLLEASLVSTEWYKLIAKSSICMQKLTLKFLTEELKVVKRILKKSDRKYENVEFLYDLNFVDVKNILLLRGRKWKKVTMTSLNFPTDLDFINFIAIIEPTIEQLKIQYFSISSVNPKEQQKKSLMFPNLKILDASRCFDSIIEVFQDVVTLTELSKKFSRYTVNNQVTNAIQKMIRSNLGSNKELKKLTTSYSAFNQITLEEISSDITYKLTSLEISGHYIPHFHISRANFTQFLRLHMNTLETLSIAEWMGLETVKVIFHMPKLKHLCLDGLKNVEESLDWKEISFKQSLSLTSLDLYGCVYQDEMLRTLITAAPNVKKLELGAIENESFAYISELLPNLESLSVDEEFDVFEETVEFHLPNLKDLALRRIDDGNIACISETFPNLESLTVIYFSVLEVTDKTYFPNLKDLTLRSIDDESIAWISNLLPNLKSLTANDFEVSDVTDKSLFPNLKEFSMMYYAQGIKESEAPEDRSNFESLFLEEKETARTLPW